MRLFAAGCRKLGPRNRQIKTGENPRRISARSTQWWRAAATLLRRVEGDAIGMVQHPLTRAMAMLARQLLPGRNQLADQIEVGRPNQHSALEAVAKGGACGEAVLPMVELARGSPVFSIASSAQYLAPRPLCRLTLPPLQVPLAPQTPRAPLKPQTPQAPVKPRAPPPTARRPQLRQNCQNHSGPGPASITSVSSRPAAA